MKSFTRKRALGAVAIAGVAALMLSACGAAPEDEGNGSAAPENDFLACAVSDEGSWQDKSFNEAAYGGLEMAAEDLGIKINDAESGSPEDFQPNLEAMVGAGCDVTFAVGFNFSLNDVMTNVATENPDSHFVWIDGWNSGETNLKPIQYSMAESSFLAGYLAAAYSTTKTVGTYGGMDIDAVTVFMQGFENGAKYYESETGTPVTVVGMTDFVGDFENTGLAKSISEGQLTAGADVIFPVAGGLFTATAEAIRESGGNAVMLGVDKDIAVTQPELADITLTSVEKRMTQAVYDVIAALVDGEEFDIEPYVGTLENDGTALSGFGEFDGQVSDEIKTKLDELKAGIIDGSIDPLAAM
ncbi:MAG: BMP family ABC transporter substrate-binding protein [Microbacterium sp.]|uniref:BMP family lipoprotein n=1 Tax=Microbacterium sp. TaxID=51671 RepID=UPI0027281488|nr:BMP family ABC transporter substrate-binding protein [Microbacterium sp.]MDO8382269.1 BMP family ABC transporter substrate-binding protein [Microbacterium sp.]